MCPSQIDEIWGIVWPETESGTVAILHCPPGFKGTCETLLLVYFFIHLSMCVCAKHLVNVYSIILIQVLLQDSVVLLIGRFQISITVWAKNLMVLTHKYAICI